MTIASEITKLQSNLEDSYTAVGNKNGTIPSHQNFDNLPTAINSIEELRAQYTSYELASSGAFVHPSTGYNGIVELYVYPKNEARSVTPTTSQQTLTVNSGYSGNGTITVSAVTSSIDPNIVAGNIKDGVSILGITGTYQGIGVPRGIVNGEYGMSGPTTFKLPDEATSIVDRGLYYGCYGGTTLQEYDMNNVRTLGAYSLAYAFYSNTGLKRLKGKITSMTGSYAMQYACYGCSNLEVYPDFSELTSVPSYAFDWAFANNAKMTASNCPRFEGVTTMTGNYAFERTYYGCSNLTGRHVFNVTTVNRLSAFNSTFTDTKITDFQLPLCTSITGNSSFNSTVGGSVVGIRVKTGQNWHPFPLVTTITGNTVFNGFNSYARCKRCIFDKLEALGNTGYNIFYDAFQYGSFKYLDGDVQKYGGVCFPCLKTIGSTTGATNAYGDLFGITANSNNSATLDFPELTNIYNNSSTSTSGHFRECGARRVFMPKVTSFGPYPQYVFYNETVVSELHFGKENEATIQAMTGYSNKFGATNATIYFDLINHITVGGVVYNRYGANYDYDNEYYSWKDSSDNVIYTKEEWTPAVGDAVYIKQDNTYTVLPDTITAVS